MLLKKNCLICKKEFDNRRKSDKYRLGKIQFNTVKYCSSLCSTKSRYGINKYQIKDGVIYIRYKTKIILASKEDEDIVNSIYWTIDSIGYPSAGTRNKTGKTIRLHNLLLGKRKGFEIDHINGNKLDNRRKNLRFVSHSENIFNSKYSNLFRGVSFDIKRKKWRAQITCKYKNIYLGRFENKEDALSARKKAEDLYFPGIRYNRNRKDYLCQK